MFMNRVILVYSEKKKSIETINSFPVFINFCTLQHKFFTYFTKGKKKKRPSNVSSKLLFGQEV